MCTDVICLFEDSSKNPNIDPRARLKSLIGNIGIKAIDNLIVFCLGHTKIGILRAFRDLIYPNILISELVNVV